MGALQRRIAQDNPHLTPTKRKLKKKPIASSLPTKEQNVIDFNDRVKYVKQPLEEEDAIQQVEQSLERERKKQSTSKVLTKVLVNMVYTFCLAYSGIELYPYQAQFAKRVIRSLLLNDGDEITALFSRQSGKSETLSIVTGGCAIILPVLANLPMFVDDDRLAKFKLGIMIGVFAPSLNQAQIIFGRSKKRMGSDSAQEVMADPSIDVNFDVSNGQNVLLSHGSIIRCQSASDNANIEGDSYHLIIVDESQDVGNFKYLKSIN
jgi:hypothetical protein